MALHKPQLKAFLLRLTGKTPQQAPAASPVQQLAHQYTGKFAFLDEQTNKTHQLAVEPDLTIKIDGRALPGQVTGITTEKLTFLDHYGYSLVITAGLNGPTAVYDEAEDATYQVIDPTAED
ncbi:DUF4828 domain-containing protein [Lacticaseibacillus kribbianus]|uniref:DUF4828 domain-containing protein n=1 Tax=Lacticaseibacillus kribbianus TaxID=2926292 RepID=UPI003084627F